MSDTLVVKDGNLVIRHGECIDVMTRRLTDCSVDAIVTDPPYELAFMSKSWDATGIAHSVDLWKECLRVLKPGGHMLVFGGTRTWHRLAVAIEDAGFEIRDSIAWLYGSGFPKSLDVSKAIDKRGGNAHLADEIGAAIKAARVARGITAGKADQVFCNGSTNWTWYEGRKGVCHPPTLADFARIVAEWPELAPLAEQIAEVDRDVIGERTTGIGTGRGSVRVMGDGNRDITAPATDDAKRWQGWGTALKPAHEPVVHAVKPLNSSGILATIGSQLDALEDACRQRASGAVKSSAPTRQGLREATIGSAHEDAAIPHAGERGNLIRTGAAESSFAATDTSVSEWTAETFSNTVTSWKACWAELSEAMNMSTMSTTISKTIDLSTLLSCLLRIMQRVTAQSTLEPASWSSLATAVDNQFAAGVLNWRSILALSAIEIATNGTPIKPQGVIEQASPAFEPIVVARKPLIGTVAANVLAHGTGALNIDACRIGDEGGRQRAGESPGENTGVYSGPSNYKVSAALVDGLGRWPANVVLDETMAEVLDEQSGIRAAGHHPSARGKGGISAAGHSGQNDLTERLGDTGGASRFFYCAKAPAKERPKVDGVAHATVKPLTLMRWLVKLVTPPGGLILDPFLGSGTTAQAAVLEGFRCYGIEREADYIPLIRQRLGIDDRETA